MKTWDFIPEFIEEFTKKLEEDDRRWGDTWLRRTRKGQEERTIKSLNDRADKYINGDQPYDNLSIIGDCYINWIRERHPELFSDRSSPQYDGTRE